MIAQIKAALFDLADILVLIMPSELRLTTRKGFFGTYLLRACGNAPLFTRNKHQEIL
jgi:hypothetical protein